MADKGLIHKWRNYTADLVSPDNFITMSFYWMMSAALQRRVWSGPIHKPLFPNLYCILVGEPGVGKGLILTEVIQMLKHHKWKPQVKEINPTVQITNDDINEILNASGVGGNKVKEPDLLFPVAADATSFEALLQSFVKANRRINVPKSPLAPLGIYTHKSMCFCLEELSSLLSKNTEKTVDFLIRAFDCGDYDYKTKHQGDDLLRKPCLSFAGGTTPSFLERTFRDNLIGDGFCARVIFVYELTNRFHRYGIRELNDQQRADRDEILAHLLELSKLYGPVTLEPDAMAFFKDYFEREMHSPGGRINPSLKLNTYYARKDIHATKLAMCIHFSKSTSMTVTLEDCQEALDLLGTLERKMHYALTMGANPLAHVSKKIIKHLQQCGEPQTFTQLWSEFIEDVRKEEMLECLNYGISTGLVSSNTDGGVVRYSFIRARGQG